MEQISIELVLRTLQEDKIYLKSTQTKLCYPIIDRIYRKMMIGVKFPNIKVIDNCIIDGHHRYLASILANVKLEMDISFMSSAKKVNDWKNVVLINEDWDTAAKIKLLNEKDAKYNNIDLNQIVELLK